MHCGCVASMANLKCGEFLQRDSSNLRTAIAREPYVKLVYRHLIVFSRVARSVKTRYYVDVPMVRLQPDGCQYPEGRRLS